MKHDLVNGNDFTLCSTSENSKEMKIMYTVKMVKQRTLCLSENYLEQLAPYFVFQNSATFPENPTLLDSSVCLKDLQFSPIKFCFEKMDDKRCTNSIT